MDKTHVQEFVDCVLNEAGESVVLLDLLYTFSMKLGEARRFASGDYKTR
jgi:hypothetical protein